MSEKLTSARDVTGRVNSPPPPLTANQAKIISDRIAKPSATIDSMVNGTKAHEKISLIILSKLGEPLKKAGVTELLLAEVLFDGLKANRTITLCKDKDGEPVTAQEPDHRVRLAALAMASKLIPIERPTNINVNLKHKHEHQHQGVMAIVNGKTLQTLELMEHQATLAIIESESNNGIKEMVVQSGNGGA